MLSRRRYPQDISKGKIGAIVTGLVVLSLFVWVFTSSIQPQGVGRLSREELGKAAWMFLHNMAANFPENPNETVHNDFYQFMSYFAKVYPCQSCGIHLENYLVSNPPETQSRQTFMEWMCELHNNVNARLEKPQISCIEYVRNFMSPSIGVANERCTECEAINT